MSNKNINMRPNMIRALQNAKIRNTRKVGGSTPSRPIVKKTGGGCGCGK